MDFFTSDRDESSVLGTAEAPGSARSSRKLKRSKTKLVTLGVAAAVAAGAFAAIQIGSANAADVPTTMELRVGYPSTVNCIVYTLQRADGQIAKNRQPIGVDPVQETLFITEQVSPGDKVSFEGGEDASCDGTFDKFLGHAEATIENQVPAIKSLTIFQ
jgi:hypothetical protein